MTPYYQDAAVTIWHGDCADVLPSLRADACITDPPYGVGVPYGPSYDDSRPDYWDWLRARLTAARAVAPVMALTHRVTALRELTDWDWVGVWSKGSTFGPRVGNSPMVAGWEPILLYGIHSIGVGGLALPDVLTIAPAPSTNRTDGRTGREKWAIDQGQHPVPKPMGLTRRLVDALTTPGQLVLDPFAGTGTTLMAAKEAGRLAVGIEIEERWCEAAAIACSQEVLGLSA